MRFEPRQFGFGAESPRTVPVDRVKHVFKWFQTIADLSYSLSNNTARLYYVAMFLSVITLLIFGPRIWCRMACTCFPLTLGQVSGPGLRGVLRHQPQGAVTSCKQIKRSPSWWCCKMLSTLHPTPPPRLANSFWLFLRRNRALM